MYVHETFLAELLLCNLEALKSDPAFELGPAKACHQFAKIMAEPDS